jgi:hypothetical protein
MGMFDSVIGRRVSPLLTTPSPVAPPAAMPSVDALLGALGGLSAPRPRPAPRLAPSLPAQSTVPAARSAGGFNPNPQLVAAIRATVPPEYQAAALATALVESGGRLDAVGDSGNSFGPFQMNRRGRLASAGYTPAQAQDPRLATTAFWNETGALARRYPGIDWADLMYRSQRPADREGYIAKLRQVMPAARQIVGGGGARPASEPTGQTLAARTTEGGGLSGDAMGALIRYAMQARDEALKGKAPSLEEGLRIAAPLMQAFRRAAPTTSAAPGAGVQRPGDVVPSRDEHEVRPGPRGKVEGSFLPVAGGSRIGAPHQGTHTIGNWQSDNAVDVGIPEGTPIYATTAGTIGSRFGALDSSNPRMAGLRLNLEGPTDNFYYAHLSRFASGIRPGVRVRAGQLLGYSGSANGTPHLHFASQRRDPRDYVG